MKKLCLAVLMLLLLLLSAAAAEEITDRCTFTYAPSSQGRNTMEDGSYLTYYTGRYLEVEMPEDAPCYGVYLCLSGNAGGYGVQEMQQDGSWAFIAKEENPFVNSYTALPGVQHLRIVPLEEKEILVAEIAILGEGKLPGWVQVWQPFEGKADLLVLSAHADDEMLFFGGVIPYYAGATEKRVQVCYLTHQTPCRRNELLDGLWLCGVREYPEMGVFKDIKNNSLGDSYVFWGEENVIAHVTGLVRKYQPEVMVTHDVKGEYGHGAHRVCADAAIQAFTLAADAAYLPEMGQPWQMKKLYLHLYKENAIEMDWRQPLEAFGGKTAFDMAEAGFECHKSQKSNGLIVQDWGQHANNRFGLYATTVGLDTEKTDFFENIP